MSTRAQRGTLVAGWALLTAHAVDETWGHPEPAGPVDLVQVLVLGAVLVLAWQRLGRRLVGGAAIVLGTVAALSALVGHVVPLVSGDAAPLDRTGPLFVVGGVLWVLAGVARLRQTSAERASLAAAEV
jgi:hypothetical protein